MLQQPRPSTLAKYGLSVQDWRAFAHNQGSVCAVCKQLPEDGRLQIDHFHVVGWSTMPPHQRKTYVRGLLCPTCNRDYMAKGMSSTKALAIVEYLTEFDRRLLRLE